MNYINTYNREHYDRLIVLLPKGGLVNIKKEALKEGVSASEFVRRLIPEYLLNGEKDNNDCTGI